MVIVGAIMRKLLRIMFALVRSNWRLRPTDAHAFDGKSKPDFASAHSVRSEAMSPVDSDASVSAVIRTSLRSVSSAEGSRQAASLCELSSNLGARRRHKNKWRSDSEVHCLWRALRARSDMSFASDCRPNCARSTAYASSRSANTSGVTSFSNSRACL